MTHDFIKKRYNSADDPFAKKNRDNYAQELKEKGYSVFCSRTIDLKGKDVYLLDADKNSEPVKCPYCEKTIKLTIIQQAPDKRTFLMEKEVI